MRSLNTYVLVAIFLLVSFLSYHFFLKDIVWNNLSQTINYTGFEEQKTLFLQKHAQQESISGLEIELKGQSDENLILLLSPDNSIFSQQVMIKKGKIDFPLAVEWKSPVCFLTIATEKASKKNITIEYRFISGK